jgi:hypothetical protein
VNSDNGGSVGAPCNDISTSITAYAVKSGLNRVICLWNRDSNSVSVDLSISLDSAFPISGIANIQKFIQDESNPNGATSTVNSSYAYSGSAISMSSLTLPKYGFVMIFITAAGTASHIWGGSWGY